MRNTAVNMPSSYFLASKIKDYFLLTKFTLSFLVVFSSVVSYLLAPNVTFNLLSIITLFFAGLCITGAANAINQTVEKDTDSKMRRTAKRPVASGRMTTTESWTFAITLGTIGIVTMAVYFNIASAALSLFSLFLYSFIYTPLKRVSSVAVIVGSVPGALPCLIGWVAATSYISPLAHFQGILANGEVGVFNNMGGYILFGIQFLWQFPHFWAIAWLAHKDYEKAGFKLLPSKAGPTRFSAIQAVIYSMIMVPVGMLPYFFGISGILSFWIILACNIWMVIASLKLVFKMNASSARLVMFSAYFYLMIVFLSMLFDKI